MMPKIKNINIFVKIVQINKKIKSRLNLFMIPKELISLKESL